MVFFNYALRKLNAKIVYYGPGLCGKTTNLQWIHDHFEGGQKGKMISLSTEGDRTIFFDLLPLDIGTIRGMQVTLQLYTVPGQVHYNSTRQLVLRGADGVVFVADSQRTMRSSNIESLHNLEENLKLQGVELSDFPHVLQFNKRDLRDLLSVDDLDHELNFNTVPFFEAVATDGVGVQETLEGIVKLVMRSLRERYEPVAAPGQRAGATTVAPPASTVAPPPPAPPMPAPSAQAAPFASAARPGAPASSVPPKPVPPAPPPFELGPGQDLVSTGVYSEEQRRRVLGERGNLTTASVDGRDVQFPPREQSSPDILGPYSVEPMTDEPTQVRDDVAAGDAAVIIRAPDVDPWAPAQKDFDIDTSKPFADQDTATDMAAQLADGAGAPAEPEFEFGVDSSRAEDLEATEESPPTVSVTEPPPPFQPPPLEPPADRDFDEAAAPSPLGEGSGTAAEAKPTVRPAPSDTPAAPPRRAAQRGSVDDLVASILGGRGKRRPTAEPSAPPAATVEPPAAPVEPPAVHVEPPFAAPAPPPRRSVTPVTVGSGDPFEVEEPPVLVEQPGAWSDPVGTPGGIVRIGDNQLHLRLQGTGAIAESGQVRALDIEVPVPGSWVGNRRVTLQLRLTLSPAAEDDNGGSSGSP